MRDVEVRCEEREQAVVAGDDRRGCQWHPGS